MQDGPPELRDHGRPRRVPEEFARLGARHAVTFDSGKEEKMILSHVDGIGGPIKLLGIDSFFCNVTSLSILAAQIRYRRLGDRRATKLPGGPRFLFSNSSNVRILSFNES